MASYARAAIVGILLFAAFAGAGTARAATSSSWIGAEADRLSSRSLTVSCATSNEDWSQELAIAGLASAPGVEYYGFSLIEPGGLHLSPYVCAGLRLGQSAATRRANELQVAWSVDVLIHESVHMGRFTAAEALTEACARVALPLELHRLYRIAFFSAEMTRLTSDAAAFRQSMGPEYQHGVCTPPGA